MEIKEIANKIVDDKGKIILVYAFNGTGKTRLSVEYKNITKAMNDNSHAGVYYNAFSEDLFQWDNDEDNDNENVKLDIVKSSLNKYHSYIIESSQKLRDYLDKYFAKYQFVLNYDKEDHYENGIESVTFYLDKEEKKPIKISRGEERIFVWCFFLTLFEVSNIAEEQNAHFFIDDPVSSLDEHNIHITANTIMDVIENNYEKKKVVVTTHHVGLFSILIDRLRKANGSDKFKKVTKTYILNKNVQDELVLSEYGHDVFLLHLHLYKMIVENINQSKTTGYLESYNFVLLRQLLENIASFLGRSGKFSSALSNIGVENANDLAALINEESHKDVYYYQSNVMSPSQQERFLDIIDKIKTKYPFHV